MFKCRKEREAPYGQADRRGFRGDGNFSARPHAGDDVPDRVRVVGQVIFQPTSPRGGRPGQRRRERPGKAISTHVPTRGTTALKLPERPNGRISTHVPTRGTTCYPRPARTPYGHYNPRPHAGDDDPTASHYEPMNQFQPTSPCGGRRAGGAEGGVSRDFNPRPHAGDDKRGAEVMKSSWNFNPRPHAGDDNDRAASVDYYRVFQPTSPRGGRLFPSSRLM